MTIKRFEDLETWQMAREFAKEIWIITNQESFVGDANLKTQINRSAGSTMDNIAEGFDRGGNREFIQFLSIARGSNSEARSQLIRCMDRGHISKDICTKLYNLNVSIGVKISNFIKVLVKSDYKGQKWNQES